MCNDTNEMRCLHGVTELPRNLCDGTQCTWDGDCANGYCNNQTCTKVGYYCNQTELFAYERDYSTGNLSTIEAHNRCVNVTCSHDSLCQSGFCSSQGICTQCNKYPLQTTNLCPMQDCEEDSACSTNVCFNS